MFPVLNFVLNKVILIQEALLFEPVRLFLVFVYVLLFLRRPCFCGKTEAKSNLRLCAVTKKRALRLEKLALRRVCKPCLCTWKRNKGNKLTITDRQIAGNRLISLSRVRWAR